MESAAVLNPAKYRPASEWTRSAILSAISESGFPLRLFRRLRLSELRRHALIRPVDTDYQAPSGYGALYRLDLQWLYSFNEQKLQDIVASRPVKRKKEAVAVNAV